MKTIKKVISLMLAAVLLTSTCFSTALGAAFTLPAALTTIEDEAFLGDSQVEGLVMLPGNVAAVGENAFRGTAVHALSVPDRVQRVEDQGTDMAYVLLAGSQTVVEGAGWAKYAIASQDAAARTWAEAAGVTFVDVSTIAADDYFLYQIADGAATLLCAIDDTAVPEKVVVPAAVDGVSVTALSENAFLGCAQVKAITLPAGIRADEGAYDGCPDAVLINAPANLRFSQAGSGLRGSWDAVEGAVAYELYRMREGEDGFTLVETDIPIETNSVSTIEFVTAEHCGPVAYAVKAVFEDGTSSAMSEPFEMTGLHSPAIVSAQQTAENAFTIVWEAVPYARSYSVVEGSYATGSFYAIASGLTETSYVIELPEDADPTATYTYHVTAYGDFGSGVWSEFVTFEGLKDTVGTRIVLSASSITLDNSVPTAQLTAEVISDTLTDKTVDFYSLDSYIADVDENGLIMAGSNGTTFIYVTAADGTTARCQVNVETTRQVISFAGVPESASKTEGFDFRFACEGAYVPMDSEWIEVEVTYLDANGGVVGFNTYGFSVESMDEECYMRADVYGASSMYMTISENSAFVPGENASATVLLVGEENAEPAYTIEFVTSNYYPGSAFQFYMKAENPETLTGEKTVTVSSADGAINTVVGSISREQPVLRAKLHTPSSWKYYDGSEETEYLFEIHVDGEYIHGLQIELYGLYRMDAFVNVGSTVERSQTDYCEIPAELPLTFAVEDASIASISETGSVTGLAAGTTTATVTAKSGASRTFTITVEEPSSEGGELPVIPQDTLPSLYIYAPAKTVVYEYDNWPTYFYAPAEIPGTLDRDTYYPLALRFYDADMQLVDSVEYDALYAEDADRTGFWFNPDEYPELDIHYVEAEVLEGELNTVSEPSSAIVQIIYPNDEPADSLGFEPMSNDYKQYAPGQSFAIPVTCTTPELIDGTAEIRAIVSNGICHFESIGTLSLTPDAPSGELVCTLSPEAVSGVWINMKILCGRQLIGSYNFMVHGGYSMMSYNMELPLGSSQTMPIAPALGVEMTDITLEAEDESVVTVNENGLVTAVGVGGTEIYVSYINEYGYRFQDSIWVEVYPVIEGELPVMTLSIDATEAAFGSHIPAFIKLDGEPVHTVSGFDVQYELCMLDANRNILTSMRSSMWLSQEQVMAGAATSFVRWPSSNRISQAAYLRISLCGDPYETKRYTVEDKAFLLAVTDIPEPGKTIYSAVLEDAPPYNAGRYLYGVLSRVESTGNLPAVAAELRDAEGNVYFSETWYRNNTSFGFAISTDGMTPAAEHTLYLYVDGEKTDCELTFYLEEPRFWLSGANRLSVSSQYALSYGFNINTDYTTSITFASSDENVVSVDQNGVMTGVGSGMATVTATTAAGQTAQISVVVCDPANVQTPEMYLAFSVENANEDVGWFSSFPVIIGTVTEPYYVSGGRYVGYRVDFLDAQGNVVASESFRDGSYHNMTGYECEVWLYANDSAWFQAFAAEAAQIRITMAADSDYDYTIDETRNTLTFDLPAAAEMTSPVVAYAATENVTPGGTFSATFTCLNPGVLTEEREVKLYDDQLGEYVAYGYLSAVEPEVTLSYQLPADWENGDSIRLHYPSRYDSGNSIAYIYTNVSTLTGFSSDRRVAVGDYTYLYPQYTGGTPAVTYSSSDESVATVEMIDAINAKVTGVSAGMATITITTDSGTSMSMKVVVYDSSNMVEPVLWLDQSLNGSVVGWDEYPTLTFCTSTDPWLIDGDLYVSLMLEYLDANGSVVQTAYTSAYLYEVFANGTSTTGAEVQIGEAYARGARSVRISMQENSYYYTLAEENLSLTYVFDELANADEPKFVLISEEYGKIGEAHEMSVVCLNPEMLDGEYSVRITSGYFENYDEVYAEGILNAQNPAPVFAIHPGSYTSLHCNVHVYDENGDLQMNDYQSVTLVTFELFPSVAAVGSAVFPNRNLPGYLAYTPVYSIADESVATVDPDSGEITGVSAGSTVLHVQCGPLSAEAAVRVYDPAAVETATLSLDVAASQPQWPWNRQQGSYAFAVKADKPVDQLGGASYVYLDVAFHDAENNRLSPGFGFSVAFSFVETNETEITLDGLIGTSDIARFAYDGAVKAVLTITGAEGSEYTFDPQAASVEIPMISLEETDDPLFGIDNSLSGELMLGGTYTVTAMAGNPNVDTEYNLLIKTPVYDENSGYGYQTLSQATITPSESQTAELTFTVPEDTASGGIDLFFYYVPADGSAGETYIAGYGYVLRKPPTMATTLAELQTAHNYSNYASQSWLYTVEGAVSLSVTFDAQTYTESAYYDPISVGTLAELESGSFARVYGGADLAGQTLTIEGDTLAISFRSDGSVTYWGFAVTQIVAAMADGSTVTITE